MEPANFVHYNQKVNLKIGHSDVLCNCLVDIGCLTMVVNRVDKVSICACFLDTEPLKG